MVLLKTVIAQIVHMAQLRKDRFMSQTLLKSTLTLFLLMLEIYLQ
mgnify:CR=1 FL=1